MVRKTLSLCSWFPPVFLMCILVRISFFLKKMAVYQSPPITPLRRVLFKNFDFQLIQQSPLSVFSIFFNTRRVLQLNYLVDLSAK